MKSSNAKLQHILSVIVNNRQVEHFLDCNLLVDNFGDPTLEAIFKYKNHRDILKIQNNYAGTNKFSLVKISLVKVEKN